MKKERKIPRVEDLERVHVSIGQENEHWVWRIKESHLAHHPFQPAVQRKDGGWTWYWMNTVHCWDGPARWRGGRYEYWIHGDYLTREEWERDPRRLQWLMENKLEGI